MNILILHAMGNPRKWLHSVATFELGLPKFDATHNYLVHNASLPLPQFVKDFPFDLILMNSSFLTSVFDRGRLQELKRQYGFIKDSNAYKVALPQDDYYCAEELDALVTEWGVDLLYTVCPEHWDVLYTRYQNTGAKLKLGFTGYITPEMLRKSTLIKPTASRKYDVTYRATGKPSFPNRLASLKANLGDIFLDNINGDGFNFSIATGKEAMIKGSAWWDFIEDSRCVLGSLSGSSNLIRNHSITDNISAYKVANPHASSDEIIGACIPAKDMERIYEAISPRVIEAGLLKATQILVPGGYSGILKEYEDYFPIKGDLLKGGTAISNKEEIKELLRSVSLQEKINEKCKETILGSKQLYLSNFFKDVVDEFNKAGRTAYTKGKFDWMKTRYHTVTAAVYKAKFATGDILKYLRSFKR